MKAGDIIFVRGDSLISRLVKLVDKGSFSHVAIAVSETEVIEANWNMKSSVVKFHYEDYEIVELNLTDNQRKQVPVVASSLVGKWYDYIQVIAYIFQSRINNPRQLICSELVYNILYSIDYMKDPNLVDIKPNELYHILKG